ncbi:MAG: amidohydrolase family protein [Fidelibacterota bacterium]
MERRQFLKSILGAILYGVLPAPFAGQAHPRARPGPSVCDVHMHLLGLGPGNGCFVNADYQRGIVYRFLNFFVEVDRNGTPEEKDRHYVDRLVNLMNESPVHRYGILLAMDGIYDDSGNLDRQRTPFYVPNEYLLEVCEKHAKLVPGASVNPLRRDALDELEQVSERGAVLIKWIPNSQNIDPSDDRILPFYRRLRELKMPLLCHGGTEYAVPSTKQSYGNPSLLQAALEEGVKVIVAHCAVDGWDHRGFYFHRFLDMLEDYPNLYGDISALTMIHKAHRLRYLLDHPDLFDRLYYGSDFPLQFFPAASPLYFIGRLSTDEAWKIQGIANVLERDVATLRALNVPDSCLERGVELVRRS